MNAHPLAIGSGDRSWLPHRNASRGDSDPRGDRRVFFSVAPDYFPRQGRRAANALSNGDRYWRHVPGGVNAELLASSPDSVALQRTFRHSGALALLATLLRHAYPRDAAAYRSAALLALEGPFLGAAPLRPDFEWAQAIPRRGDLATTDWRTNHDGFLQMNGIVGLFDTLALLQPPAAHMRRFQAWVACALSTCPPYLRGRCVARHPRYPRPLPQVGQVQHNGQPHRHPARAERCLR